MSKTTITNRKFINVKLSNGKTVTITDDDTIDEITLTCKGKSIPVPKSNLITLAGELIKLAK